MGDEGWRDADVILGASLLATTCFAGAAWLTAMGAVALFAASLLGGSEWMFYVQFNESDGSSQTLWYKDPGHYDDQVARGVVRGTIPLEMYVNTDEP